MPFLICVGVAAAGSGCAIHERVPQAPGESSSLRTLPPTGPTMAPQPGFPQRLVIPSLGVAGTIVALQLEGSALIPPANPAEFGWWAGGRRPGSAHGSALITGHAVHDGSAPFNDLDRLRPGSDVLVTTSARHLHYRVSRVQVLNKDELAQRAERLFRQDGAARLVLVSCEDYDGHEFRANTVVFATPVGSDNPG